MFETTVKIDGMMCGMCEAHVNDAVRNAIDVKKVSSSHKKGTMTILSQAEPDPQAIADAITAAGYEYVSSATRAFEKRGLFGR